MCAPRWIRAALQAELLSYIGSLPRGRPACAVAVQQRWQPALPPAGGCLLGTRARASASEAWARMPRHTGYPRTSSLDEEQSSVAQALSASEYRPGPHRAGDGQRSGASANQGPLAARPRGSSGAARWPLLRNTSTIAACTVLLVSGKLLSWYTTHGPGTALHTRAHTMRKASATSACACWASSRQVALTAGQAS